MFFDSEEVWFVPTNLRGFKSESTVPPLYSPFVPFSSLDRLTPAKRIVSEQKMYLATACPKSVVVVVGKTMPRTLLSVLHVLVQKEAHH